MEVFIPVNSYSLFSFPVSDSPSPGTVLERDNLSINFSSLKNVFHVLSFVQFDIAQAQN